jgi:UDP-N-acetylglucosamine--N-acetylmuramyl-(pentapeptide) pyrophosphoryl-undecaprenol N-acetylglucosamine transferase
MTYAIAAAGTGGHVFPGLAVGEALVALGIPPADVLFVGGGRLEAEVYPAAGFPFTGVELAGLQRRLTLSNLRLPLVVMRAARALRSVFEERKVRSVLGLGGYVTVPAGLAATGAGAALMLSEQNALAGLANRLMARRAVRVFGSFPATRHLPRAEWVGNPVREELARFDRRTLRLPAREGYGLALDRPVVGVVGGSLGAGAINQAVADMLQTPRPFQVLHLAGTAHAPRFREAAAAGANRWEVVGFENQMARFYAASDLVVARSGGAVAELTATATPAVLIPGSFGSAGHQQANAAVLARAGAAVVLAETELRRLGDLIGELVADQGRLAAMASAARSLAKPAAAADVAAALRQVHG